MDEHAVGCDLDILGVLEGTDKSSAIMFSWDYLRHYQTLFAPWRDEPINLIEIGVENGPSLTVWKNFFPHARIIGIDINPECRRFAGDRVVIEIGSQEDPGLLHRVCAEYPPSIIIDDASHLAHHIVYSFKCLFPMLQPGGVYVVEDMELHFAADADLWAGNKTVSAPEYFLDLARAKLANRNASCEVWGTDRYIRDWVDTVSFFGGALAIHKRKTRDVARALVYAEQYLGSINPLPLHLFRLADYVLRHNGPLDYAERAIRRALSLGGSNAEALRKLADVLSRQGRLDEAADAAAELTRLAPDDHTAWGGLAYAEQRRGRAGAAIAALEKAASLDPAVAEYHDQLAHLLQQQGDVRRALAAAHQAVHLTPSHERWQQRVSELERLASVGTEESQQVRHSR